MPFARKELDSSQIGPKERFIRYYWQKFPVL
jgi:hypothetical protein